MQFTIMSRGDTERGVYGGDFVCDGRLSYSLYFPGDPGGRAI